MQIQPAIRLFRSARSEGRWQLCRVLLLGLCLTPTVAPGESPTGTRLDPLAVERVWAAAEDEGVRRHFADLSAADWTQRQRQKQHHRTVLEEQLLGAWFAALLPLDPADQRAIVERFGTWRDMIEFFGQHNGLLEVWAYPEGNRGQARRIPADERTARLRDNRAAPTFLTFTWQDEASARIIRCRVEFGFHAASEAVAADAGFRRHRQHQLALIEALNARDDRGRPSARAQWAAFKDMVDSGRGELLEMPQRPSRDHDLFVAAELEVDERSHFVRFRRFYRASQITRRLIADPPRPPREVLVLRPDGSKPILEAGAYVRRQGGLALEPVSRPRPGRDWVELRVEDPAEPDARRWTVLEFGETELLRQSALAQFSLLQAYLERQRRQRALKKFNYDLIAETVFTGLNLGGGLSGVPLPLGDGARLIYDLTVARRFLPRVPTPEQLRDLFRLVAAREIDPVLRTIPAHYLNEADLAHLQQLAASLTEPELQACREELRDEDLAVMLRLARMQRMDAEVSNLLAILGGIARVTDQSQAGVLRAVFANPFFTPTGEIDLTGILAAVVGNQTDLPLHQPPLRDLVEGTVPWTGWLRHLSVTVDIRAVMNTVSRLNQRSLAARELQQPLPHAPRLSDLAAYEIRVFGFPLLLFHKRGLLKADLHAFSHDYAYGVIGTRIVERFSTRESFETEIRAGRLLPLGFVRVRDAEGQWRDTHLTVFAHRVPAGRHQGRTALILYGLKAYEERSLEVRRQYDRFRAYEQALTRGGVIEQLLDAEHRHLVPVTAFEPRLDIGPEAVETQYSALLGALLERRHLKQRQAWGMEIAGTEAGEPSQWEARLEAAGVRADDPLGDPLLEVDPWFSAYTFRRQTADGWQTIRRVLIPCPSDIERQLLRAKDEQQLADWRRKALLPGGSGLILLNEVREVAGRHEIGPLLRGPEGELLGFGVRAGHRAISELLRQIDRMPVIDRARWVQNRLAATVVELDLDGNGTPERVFLTCEFPVDGVFEPDWTDPLSGRRERHRFKEGRLIARISDDWLTELDYDAAGIESGHRVHRNLGTIEQPVRGELAAETRTLEIWFRNLTSPNLDPHAPRLRRLRVDHITGRVSRDTFGLFPLPVETVDNGLVRHVQYDPWGLFLCASIRENRAGPTVDDPTHPWPVLHPDPGFERFRERRIWPPAESEPLAVLAAGGWRITLAQRDNRLGLERQITYDAAGRQVIETRNDPMDGERTVEWVTVHEYEPTFQAGLIPHRSVRRHPASGTILAQSVTEIYEATRGHLISRESDSTGRSWRTIRDFRRDRLLAEETARRRTVYDPDPNPLVVRGQTLARDTGKPVAEFSGLFDPETQTWLLERQWFHRPGIRASKEHQQYSATGRLLVTTVGNVWEIRPLYDASGREIARQFWGRSPDSNQFDQLLRQEDDYRWHNGSRNARVRTWVAGTLHDTFRTVQDEEGRLVTDQIRFGPDLRLRTDIEYEGDSTRRRRVTQIHNDAVRATHSYLRESPAADGSWWLVERVSPRVGRPWFSTWQLDDPLGRRLTLRDADGKVTRVTQWYPGTAIPWRTETRDQQGRVTSRQERHLNAGAEDGLAYDLVHRYQVDPWGRSVRIEDRACLRGTDLAFFSNTTRGRHYFDLRTPFEVLRYTIDPNGRQGLTVPIDGHDRAHVVEVALRNLNPHPQPPEPTDPAPPQYTVVVVDLRGFFAHTWTRQFRDADGKSLREERGRIRCLGPKPYTDENLRARVAEAVPEERVSYHYEPGWWVAEADEPGATRVLTFEPGPSQPRHGAYTVNANERREFATRIDHYRVESHAPEPVLVRTLSQPRQMDRNPFVPDLPQVWTEWTIADWEPDGRLRSEGVTIVDALGEPRLIVARQRTARGQHGARVLHRIRPPPAEQFRPLRPPPGQPLIPLRSDHLQDLANCDFLCLWSRAIDHLRLRVTDQKGRAIWIGSGSRPDEIAFWPATQTAVQWLPTPQRPRVGLSVTLAGPSDASQPWLIAVSDLAAAGLDIARMIEFALEVSPHADAGWTVSPVQRLQHGGPGWRATEEVSRTQSVDSLPGGLTLRTTRRQLPEKLEPLLPVDVEFYLSHDDRLVAQSRRDPSGRGPPTLVFLDATPPEGPQPLYQLAWWDGRFIDLYQTLRTDNSYLRAIPSGLGAPRFEMCRGRFLDDHIAPGWQLEEGDVALPVRLTRTANRRLQWIVRARNRAAANIFQPLAHRCLPATPERQAALRGLAQLRAAAPDNAESLAAAITHQPTLAEVLLTRTSAPWPDSPGWPQPLNIDPAPHSNLHRMVRARFLETAAHSLRIYPQTGLLPTAPGTTRERYVDTVREADWIQLAIALNEPARAQDLLAFYWRQSRGGQESLHASYDAVNGASRRLDPTAQRPLHSPKTAEAQLAVAEAAFAFWLQRGDPMAFQLGSNLLSRVLEDFRPHSIQPRGVVETLAVAPKHLPGMTLWPEEPRYTVRSNARTFRLLNRLLDREKQVRPAFTPTDWERLRQARDEQKSWLHRHLLPEVERTGVIPRGFFQVRDHRSPPAPRAIAAERWTTAEDWLAWIDVAEAMGQSRERTRNELDRLARVHGVTVGEAWGLDWSLSLGRPALLSMELTAHFHRLACQLGHEQAARRSGQSLLTFQRQGMWPAVVTTAQPQRPLPTGEGSWVEPLASGEGWPSTLSVFLQRLPDTVWDNDPRTVLRVGPVDEKEWVVEGTDLIAFLVITAAFYISVLGVALFWWGLRAYRLRWHSLHPASAANCLVAEPVQRRAEQRWARRVLGMTQVEGTAHTRYANGVVEPNFLMPLRSLYKLVVEWRREENGWPEDDPRLVDDATDAWLNGLDELCVVAGLYMRWVIKAGAKDGRNRENALEENEDSNHIWSRLVLYFTDYHAGLLTLLQQYRHATSDQTRTRVDAHIVLLLNAMGLRQRAEPFDARLRFHYPADPEAFDLLQLQQPRMTLTRLVHEMASRLLIPQRHIVRFIRKYKEFKRREVPYPLHPWIVDAARVLPHFLLMALGALVIYNRFAVGDSSMVRYLWENVITRFAFDPVFVGCGLILTTGLGLTVVAHLVRLYRWEATMTGRTRPEFLLDKTLTALLSSLTLVLPLERPGKQWQPERYQKAAWTLRALGFLWLAILLFQLPTPSFATFLAVKGLLAMLALAEAGAILLPAVTSWLARRTQDWVSDHPQTLPAIQWFHQLNLVPTRPTSLLWQSLRYHFRPSAPSGNGRQLAQAIVSYGLLAALFFTAGVFLCQAMLPLWFTEQYRLGADWKLVVGGLLFWCMLYLLRYGLFVLFTAVASWLVAFPLMATCGCLAILHLILVLIDPLTGFNVQKGTTLALPFAATALILILAAPSARAWLQRRPLRHSQAPDQRLARRLASGDARLGVVYMGGDELSALQWTPDRVLDRWLILRDRLESTGARVATQLTGCADDATLREWLTALWEAEQRGGVTLWHPLQLVLENQTPPLPPELGLNVVVTDRIQRSAVLAAWHVRRLVVTMMSTAGQSHDTGINLVEIALRLCEAGLGAHTVFYLIQNKYDNSGHNRPSQLDYHAGELQQRNQLARLLAHIAPGSRAFSLQNWTPFGFKAGGLTGMDLVPEESLRLSTVLLLDRNATVYDLNSLVADLQESLADPNLVMIIPGRNTTNTLTDVGQASQLVEEGHRSFLQGLMGLMGGGAGECLGTGWGNIFAFQYGAVQRAMLDPETPRMPLTSRLSRGASFRLKLEGLIGFGPHAVGISEDTWAASQAMHNAIALGRRARFGSSRARWRKLRETWSHAEWLTSFPRWSGGYWQMMQDPLMQHVNEFGPLSVFARDLRANSGRFYLTAMPALFSILLMPLAILLDVAPFVQILILLWNLGFVVNQVLALHGLLIFLEAGGFNRATALAGLLAAATLTSMSHSLRPLAPSLLVLGCLAGGFAAGLGRWLITRLRDILLFGPQLVLHALSQMLRQSLEFVVSGAAPTDARNVNIAYRAWVGPREDQPFDRYPHGINLRTVVWGVGLVSLWLNVWALTRLDLLNVLMLLPSLLFSVSALIGPFLLRPAAGSGIGRLCVLAKALGWLCGFGFYLAVSWLLGLPGVWMGLGGVLLTLPFLQMARHGLQHATFPIRLARARQCINRKLQAEGWTPAQADALSLRLMKSATGKAAAIDHTISQAGLRPSAAALLRDSLQQTVQPLLASVRGDPNESKSVASRFGCQWNRSFALSVFVLLWLFLAPVPGVFVLNAGNYQLFVGLRELMTVTSILLTLVLVMATVGWLTRTLEWHSASRHSLNRRIYQVSLALGHPWMDQVPSAQQAARLCADLTELEICLDQLAHVPARECLARVETELRILKSNTFQSDPPHH
jgi:hypothetical protein